jgi:hypothetical protein
MKTILEALPKTEPASKSEPRPTKSGESSPKERNRRRSERRPFDAVIRVYGSTESGKSFYEEARTINVSTHGALLELNVAARVGQKLMLINEATQRQQICKIVNIRSLDDKEAIVVAVEFPVPHAEFWHVFSAPRKTRPSEKKGEPRINKAETVRV